MAQLCYEQYLEYIQVSKTISKHTLNSYRTAIKTCDLKCIDTNGINAIWKLLLDKLNAGVSYGAIRLMFILTRALLKLHGITYSRDYDYNMLEAKLAKCGSIPEAYTEKQLREIIAACQKEDLNLFRICLLCVYSGLRISACQGLRYSDFQKVAVPPNGEVYIYQVSSKCRKYNAVISGHAFKLLKASNLGNSEIIVDYSPDYKSPFDKLYRSKMAYVLVKNNLAQLTKDRVIFHSMRKFFAQQLGEAGLNKDDIALLMGHAPDSIAYKHYIDTEDQGMSNRLARAYARTSLYSLELV